MWNSPAILPLGKGTEIGEAIIPSFPFSTLFPTNVWSNKL